MPNRPWIRSVRHSQVVGEHGTLTALPRCSDARSGVRVTRTGEKGWIFGNLVEQVSRSQLGAEGADAGFQALSEDFDRLFGDLGRQLGYRLVESVEQAENNTLRITPSPEFLL